MRIKRNDQVLVIAGKEKGKKGKVIRVDRVAERIVVEKVNIIKKHVKKTRENAGQRIELEAPFHASNAQVVCPSCKKPTRVSLQVSKSGKKIRTCKKCEASVEQPFIKS